MIEGELKLLIKNKGDILKDDNEELLKEEPFFCKICEMHRFLEYKKTNDSLMICCSCECLASKNYSIDEFINENRELISESFEEELKRVHEIQKKLIGKKPLSFSKDFASFLKEENLEYSKFVSESISQQYTEGKRKNLYLKTLKSQVTDYKNKFLQGFNNMLANFDKVYKNNENLLGLLEILIKNYISFPCVKDILISLLGNFEPKKFDYLNLSDINSLDINYLSNYFLSSEIFRPFDLKKDRVSSFKSKAHLLKFDKGICSINVLKNKALLGTTYGGDVFLYDIGKKSKIKETKLSGYYAYSFKECDDKRILLACCRGFLAVLSQDLDLLEEVQIHQSCIFSIGLISDKIIVTGTRDGEVGVWNCYAPYKEVSLKKAHKDLVSAVYVLKDKKRFVSGSNDNSVIIWSSDDYSEICRIYGAFCVYPNSICEYDNKLFVGGNVKLTCIDLATYQILNSFYDDFFLNSNRNYVSNGINCVRILDKRTIIFGGAQNKMCLVDYQTGEFLYERVLSEGIISDIVVLENVFICSTLEGNLEMFEY